MHSQSAASIPSLVRVIADPARPILEDHGQAAYASHRLLVAPYSFLRRDLSAVLLSRRSLSPAAAAARAAVPTLRRHSCRLAGVGRDPSDRGRAAARARTPRSGSPGRRTSAGQPIPRLAPQVPATSTRPRGERRVAAGAIPWRIVRLRSPQPIQQNVAALQTELEALARLARDARAPAKCSSSAGNLRPAPSTPPTSRSCSSARRSPSPARIRTPRCGSVRCPPIPRCSTCSGARRSPPTSTAWCSCPATESPPRSPGSRSSIPASRSRSTRCRCPIRRRSRSRAPPKQAAAGVTITLFAAPDPIERAAIEPLLTLAREFHGDLSYDPYTKLEGAEAAWAFVRGEDLGLRIVGQSPPGFAQMRYRLADPQLRNPQRVDLASGTAAPVEATTTEQGLELLVPGDPVTVLRVERVSVEELGGQRGAGRRRRRARDAGRGDPAPAAGVRGRPEPQARPLPGPQHHAHPLSGRAGVDRGRLRGRLLLEARRGLRLGVVGVHGRRRQVAIEEAARAAADPAREGGRAAARDPVHQGVPVPPARHRDHRRPRHLGHRLQAARGHSRPQPLPGHGVGRPRALRAGAHARDAARARRRRAVERGDLVLHADRHQGQPRRGRARASCCRPAW